MTKEDMTKGDMAKGITVILNKNVIFADIYCSVSQKIIMFLSLINDFYLLQMNLCF